MENIGIAIIIGALIGIVIGLCIQFLPTIIAFSKGQSNKGTVLVLNIANFGIGILSSIVFGWLFPIPVISILISIALFIFWIIILVKAIRGF